MTERVDCPVCGQSEVISVSRLKPSWSCRHCGASADKIGTVVVRFGNHYLVADRSLTVEEYVADMAHASQFDFAWAEGYRLRMSAQNKVVNAYTIERAVAIAQVSTAGNISWAYTGRFESELYRLMGEGGTPSPAYTYHVPGVGCASYQFALDGYKARGLTAQEAAADYYAGKKPRLAKR